MSQESIMHFLDDHKGQLFTAKDIFNLIGNGLSIYSIHRALRTIVKREEYKGELNIASKHKEIYYGRI